ncbi:hypothetical protein [Actinophytocola oryzae]|uniref:Uncharacterized protein n=1 Tax=Actinophytocola oryzae TaxID=502181 RepID=A0A4R7VNZ7_9PSEU|nr:hypothetical protein [Actinophytocola oryzae]TDV51085.1 hypothetical protein CLV71_106436 [Actinophytocola oryzae]
MLRDFIARLDSYISRKGPGAALRVLVVLMAVVGVVGAVFDNPPIRVLAIVGVITLGVSCLIILLADRHRLQRRQDTQRELLARYCDFVIDNKLKPLVSISNWHHKVYVQPNGDVREVAMIKAVALRDEVHFIRFHLGSEWPQPEEQRRNVTVRARGVNLDGMLGPQWNVTNTWLSDAKLNSIVHFRSPVRRGEEIRLEMVRFWPAKCRPLMRERTAEDFFFRTTDLMQIQRVEYQVILPLGFDVVHRPIGFSEPDDHTSIDAYTDIEGRRVVVCRASRLPHRQSVGMRLELV